MSQNNPTKEFYDALQMAYDFFNQTLFDNQLPRCLITTQRDSQAMGHFSAARWVNWKGDKVHEISCNPAYFANHTLMDVLQTMVHEQCHLWQFEFGKPSRTGYHNHEWAKKMEKVGLIPSSTGIPGGRKTGQNMSDYPEPGGRFMAACKVLIKDFELPWVDRFMASRPSSQIREQKPIELIENEEENIQQLLTTQLQLVLPEIIPVESQRPTKAAKRKVRYSCPDCRLRVWGKPGLNIFCGDCGISLQSGVEEGNMMVARSSSAKERARN